METNKKEYDVIIAGAGIVGNMLSKIFSANNLNVLLLEQGKHPRFSLGEAMLPQSAIWPFMIGEYYGIDEIKHLSNAEAIIDNITPNCGIKHSIGFIHHETNEIPSGDKIHQLIPPSMPFYSESHLLREDIDNYLLTVAKNAGADYYEETAITGVEIQEDIVAVTTNKNTFYGKYYIDSSGKNSLLAKEKKYRNVASNLKSNSRAIFTHVQGLKPIDMLLNDEDHPKQKNQLHHGTLHHVFDGGWVWVIPFDNHHRSSSKLTSVGLMLDPNKFPVNDKISAEEEFQSIIEQFPMISKHLKTGKNVRPWTRSSGNLQYASNQSVGHRHMTTNNTYGFVDPLYSNGLINSFETVFYASKIILNAFKNEDFSSEQFQPIEKLHKKQLQDSDLMISNAYKAMKCFKTWNAWTQLWLGQVLFHDLYLQRLCFKYFESGDKTIFENLIVDGRPGDDAPFMEKKKLMLNEVEKTLNDFEANRVNEEKASSTILKKLQEQDWLPKHVYDWGNPLSRNVDFTNMELVKSLIGWGMNDAPENIKSNLFDFKVPF